MSCPYSIYYTRSRELKCKLTNMQCQYTKIPKAEECTTYTQFISDRLVSSLHSIDNKDSTYLLNKE